MSHDKPKVHDNRFTFKCHPVHCVSINVPLVTTLTDMMKLLHPLSCRIGKPQSARGIPKLKELSDRHQDVTVEDNRKKSTLKTAASCGLKNILK